MNGRAIVLAHAHDVGAAAVASRLSASLGAQDLVVVRPETLGLARWSHRLGSNAEVQTRITLPSGMQIDSSMVTCLFNRLQYIQSPRFASALPKDRDYALAEQQALIASWLHGLGSRVVNPAGPRAQARGPVSRRGWLALAVSCGLPVLRSIAATSGGMIGVTNPGERLQLRTEWPGGARGPVPAEVTWDTSGWGDEESLLVAGDRVVGALADRFGGQCYEVAQRSGCPLLEFRFGRIRGAHAVREVDPLPPLTQALAVSAVAELLLQTATHLEQVR